MVIGFDGSRAFGGERTGTENYCYKVLLYLSKIDRKNKYIVYLRPGARNKFLQGWPPNFLFKTINFKFLWTQIGLALQTFKDDLDLLFVPSHTTPLIKKPGLKTIMTVHDLGAEYLPAMHQLKQTFYLKWITRFQLKCATRLIAVSNATKTDIMKKINIPSKNIKVIYEGIDSNFFISKKGKSLVDSLKQFDLKPNAYFLYVGTIQPRKNLERLIEAFYKVTRVKSQESSKNQEKYLTLASDLRLVLVGSKGWISDDIYALSGRLGIGDRVKFLGHIPDSELPALYSGAKALVFPSLFEGFGLTILEAFSCGCPVLTSNVSSMPEIAGDAAMLVNPYDTGEIADSMMKLGSDEKLRESLIRKGFERVKQFSWEKCAKETLELFREVSEK